MIVLGLVLLVLGLVLGYDLLATIGTLVLVVGLVLLVLGQTGRSVGPRRHYF